jgi:hypothetical protein
MLGKSQKNLPVIMYNMMKGSSSSQMKICTSLLAMIKGDISMARPVSDELNIDHEMIMPIIAAATGNVEVFSDFYEVF